jgi:hypothetical protein
MKCFNNGWKQRYRDLNAAMKIFRFILIGIAFRKSFCRME